MKCCICQQSKSKEDFHYDQSNKVYYKRCKVCFNKKLVTREEYTEFLVKQGGKCAICGNFETVKRKSTGITFKLCVDHCHTTGRVRGLLCNKCNLGLGKFKDNPESLITAYKYLST